MIVPMRILLSLTILAALLLCSCTDGSANALPEGWPVAGMTLPSDAEITEPIPALKLGMVFMTVGDGETTDYSETVAFYSDEEFRNVVSEMEAALKAEGYWSLPGKNGQALNIRGYISASDDAFVTVMYTPLKDMFAVQAVTTAQPSDTLKERREKEGTEL